MKTEEIRIYNRWTQKYPLLFSDLTLTGDRPLTVIQLNPWGASTLDQSRIVFEIFPCTGTDDITLSRRHVIILNLFPSHNYTLQQIPALTEKYNRAISTYQNHLVFLDRDYAFCTLRLDRSWYNDAVRKHFYLPKDWPSPGMLALCTINCFRTILCPKDSEVAVIQNGLRDQ